MTLEGWPDITDAAVSISWGWGLYCIAFIMVTNMSLINLATGVVVKKVMVSAADKAYGTPCARARAPGRVAGRFK